MSCTLPRGLLTARCCYQISGFPDTVENLNSASVPESSTSKGLLALGVIVGTLKIFQSNKRRRDSERQILSQSN